MRAAPWLPPLAWMGLILWLGSDSGNAERTGRLILPLLHWLFPAASPLQLDAMHAVLRKLGHITEYAVLAALWLRAFVATPGMGRARAAWRAWLIAVAWAGVDESLQSMVASRTGSAYDVAIDAVGALLATLIGHHGRPRVLDALTHTALWSAAVGGTVLIIVNVTTDVRSGVLWLTVPTAVLALVALRRVKP